MKYNHMMFLKLCSVNLNVSLDKNLERIVDRGFFMQQDCYFLKAVAKIKGPLAKNLFFDDIDIEHSINEIHIDEISHHLKLSRIKKQDSMAQSLIFISKVFEKWRKQFEPLVLVSTLSESDNVPDSAIEYGVTLSFYVKRSDRISWLCEDLEDYKENAVLEVNSQDDILSEINKLQSVNSLLS